MMDAETRLLIEQLVAAGNKLQAEVWATYGPLPRVEPLYEEWHKATDDLAALLQSVRSVTPQEPLAEHLSPVEAGIRRRAKAQRENSFIYDSVEVATTDREELLVMLDTERTMSAAWRKRAMEAEAATPPKAVTPPEPSALLKRMVMSWDTDDDLEFLAAVTASRKHLGIEHRRHEDRIREGAN